MVRHKAAPELRHKVLLVDGLPDRQFLMFIMDGNLFAVGQADGSDLVLAFLGYFYGALRVVGGGWVSTIHDSKQLYQLIQADLPEPVCSEQLQIEVQLSAGFDNNSATDIKLLEETKGMDKTFETLMTKHVPKSNEVEGNPWDVIPIKNVKQAKNTTEVHLGQRKITKLVNFVDFPNLEVLWVNKNSLESFEGLEHNFRLKHIFAQENKLKTINKIFEKLKHIETLVLYDNELRDLQKLIRCLRQLKNLKHLDLFNNPASHEPNYKFRVIHALPTLQILDRHKISLHQRMEAQTFINSKGKKAQKPFNLNV